MAGRIGRRKNTSVSRLKALVSVIDIFSRSPESPATLGTISGAPWSVQKGSWGVSSGKALSGDNPSTYPLATLTFTKEDVTLSVDGVGPGMGTSFWVSDAGNWWGTVVDGEQACQTCYNTGTCQQFFTCCNGNYNPVVPGNTFTCCTGNTNPVVPGNTYSYTVCNSTAYQNVYFIVNYTCGCNAYCSQGCNGAPGSSCGLTFAQAQACGGCKRCSNSAGGFTYCASSSTAFGTNPSTGGNCNQFGTCYNPSSGGNCNAFAANCCFAYNTGNAFSCNCVVNNKIKVIKSVSGVISTIATFSYNATVAGFKTILSGNNVTVQAFSGSGYSSQIGSNQSTTVSGYTKTKKHGILKGPVTFADAQTSEINEFRVS